MNKKDFKKQFINEFKQENTPTTSFNDVFKEKPKEENTYYKKYLSLNRKFKLSIAFSCIMLLVLIVGLSVSLVYIKDYDNHNYDNNCAVLTQEEKQFISDICVRNKNLPTYSIQITNTQYLLLYEGLYIYNDAECICYFYKVINYVSEFKVMFDSNILVINDNNKFGLFLMKSFDTEVYFMIDFQNNQKKYII